MDSFSSFSISPYFPLSSMSQNNNNDFFSSGTFDPLYNFPPQSNASSSRANLTSSVEQHQIPSSPKRKNPTPSVEQTTNVHQSPRANNNNKSRKGGKKAKFDPDYSGPLAYKTTSSSNASNNTTPSAPIFPTSDDLWNHLRSRFESSPNTMMSLRRITTQLSQEYEQPSTPQYNNNNNNHSFLNQHPDPFSSSDNLQQYVSSPESSGMLMSDSSFDEPILFGSPNDQVVFSDALFADEQHHQHSSQQQHISHHYHNHMANPIPNRAFLNEIMANQSPAGLQQSNGYSASLSLENRGGLFELKQPLRVKQRKSYEHENRYLTPNPVIAIKESVKDRFRDLRIKSGIVSVELVDGSGNTLAPEKQKLLGCSSQGGTHQLLNPYNLSSTRFQLKIFENSRGQSYRLKFYITYITENKTSEQEVIFSNPFQVESNKKKPKSRTNVINVVTPTASPQKIHSSIVGFAGSPVPGMQGPSHSS